MGFLNPHTHTDVYIIIFYTLQIYLSDLTIMNIIICVDHDTGLIDLLKYQPQYQDVLFFGGGGGVL